MWASILILYFQILCIALRSSTLASEDVLVVTLTNEVTDELHRLLRSARHNNLNVKVIGLSGSTDEKKVPKSIGDENILNILRHELYEYKDNDELIILFLKSPNAVILDGKDKILEQYGLIGKRVLFSSEDSCWPDSSLENLYPAVEPNEKRYLNSGAFIGPASELYRMINIEGIENDGDDQLYYTKIFLDEDLRREFDIGLDKSARIFQNMYGAFSEIELKFNDDTGYLINNRTNSRPIIARGNGPSKHEFDSLTNYLDHNWTPLRGCQQCEENTIDMESPEAFPVIQLSIFIDEPTPFLDTFFKRIAELTYPKDRIHLTGYVAPEANKQKKIAEEFNAMHGLKYRSSTWLDNESVKTQADARNTAFSHCLAVEQCQFLFAITGTVQLTVPNTIENLVKMNRPILAPLVTRRGKLWSNFWGAITSDGFYDRSEDYVEIVEGTRRGIWNVPFVRDVYLLSRSVVEKLTEVKFGESENVYMEVAQQARKNYFLMVDNRESYGYLTNAETYSLDHVNNDLWQIFDNPVDWEEQYVHPGYFELLPENVKMTDIQQPCPDVFYFPIVTKKFCKQIVEEMEHFGQWSDGSNKDPRLEGGYENVPTRDIHMRQIDWEKHWLHFLVKYIHPIQRKVFEGYEDKPWARMNFVVRYRPDEQPYLRPHHDASSFTLNICLNQPGVDYQGGGTRFLRYNCSVTKPEVGWTSMFPGRVTHLHEGLTTTAGTRYIFVTFVNP